MVNYKYPPEIDHSQVLKLVEKEDIEALIAVVKTSKNPAVLKHAILFLGEYKVSKAVEPLIILLLSEFESVRHFSALALGEIGDKKAIKPLSMLLNQPKENDLIRKEVLKSLVRLNGGEAKESISQNLTSEWGSETLSVLKEIGQPAVKYLLDALGSADYTFVGKVATVLGQIGESAKAATPQLIKILETTSKRDNPNCSLLESVLIALALIKDHDAVEPLIKAIKYDTSPGDVDYAVQNWIIFALADIGDKLATEPLTQLMLRNSESRIRGIAAAALGKIGDNQAVESLISVLENKKDNLWVRDNAAWALLQLEEGTTALPLLRYLKWNHKNIFDSLKGFQFPSEFKNEASEG